jgi:ornithine cyclodeaminase/alanine dehydrogenase-like protein (mu-crystallin family)
MSRVLILSEAEVRELLTMRECIGVMEDALSALARGEVLNPLRSKLAGPHGLLGLMPAHRAPYFGLKEVCVVPGRHVGAVLLHSDESGELLAVMNAEAITAIRTAAVSAVATRLLARENSTVLAVLGTGTQAKSHLEAIPLVRPIREVRTYSRSGGSAGSVEEAVRGADIIVTATSAREPILRREWVAPGTHINAVGSSIPSTRELDTATVASARLFVDRRESTVNESGDYLFAAKEQPIQIEAEIGEILVGKAAGRKSEEEITLFKSLGLAVEDLAAAAFLFEKAQRLGTGTWVEF